MINRAGCVLYAYLTGRSFLINTLLVMIDFRGQ